MEDVRKKKKYFLVYSIYKYINRSLCGKAEDRLISTVNSICTWLRTQNDLQQILDGMMQQQAKV